MTLTITWQDGTTDTAADADAMLARLADKRMDDRVDIMRALAKRVMFWSDGKVLIDPETADAMTVLDSMLKAGMLTAIEVAGA